MAIETELKLRLTPENLAKLRRHKLFKTHQITAPQTRRLHNIYFDTPKLELHARKMALRLRRVGGQWLQTLKGGGQVMAGLHQRNEWEIPVPSAKLDFSALDEVVWNEHLPHAIHKNLKPVFITDFYRSSRILDWQGTHIEVCMDQGEVKTKQSSSPICEVELELKSGEPQKLFELAQALLEIVPLELEVISKAEQGFRLLSNYTAQPVKSGLLKFTQTDNLTSGLQALIWSCLLHFQTNLPGAMASGEMNDAEYLHQLRVALRRLRVILRMAEKIHADTQLTVLRAELAVLGSTLGQIREWDVFISQTLQPISTTIKGQVGQCSMQALLASSEQQRADCYSALHAQSTDFQHLLLRFAIWMNGEYWREAGQIAPNTLEFSTKRLSKLYRQYRRAGAQLSTLDAFQLHALRICTKKLRYSGEFFASLFGARKARAFLSALSEVQELLGHINDITIAHRMLDKLSNDLPTHEEVIAFIKVAIATDLSKKHKKLRHSIKLLSKQDIFWE